MSTEEPDVNSYQLVTEGEIQLYPQIDDTPR